MVKNSIYIFIVILVNIDIKSSVFASLFIVVYAIPIRIPENNSKPIVKT